MLFFEFLEVDSGLFTGFKVNNMWLISRQVLIAPGQYLHVGDEHIRLHEKTCETIQLCIGT